MSQTASIQGVATLNQGFMSNEIEDLYASHLDLNGFCTVDNGLQGVDGDIRKINTYGAVGSAEDVAEGQGNSGYISTTLIEKEYRVKCAQAWFRYSDEALMRDSVAVQTGITKLGVSLFDKVNADLYNEMKKASQAVIASKPDFDAFVDAAAKINFADGNETAREYQGRTIPTLWAIMDAQTLAQVRKEMKNQLVYDPNLAWNQGYVGTVAGIALFVKKNATQKMIYVGTDKAVTIFNKTGVTLEKAARAKDEANKRLNDVFTRKYYIAALTRDDQIVQLALTGATVHAVQVEEGDGATVAFALDHTETDTPVVAVNGEVQTSGYSVSSHTVTFSTAPADGAVITIDYHYTAS